MGEKRYKGSYALLALLGLVLIIYGKYQAPFVAVWHPPLWTRYIVFTIMPIEQKLIVQCKSLLEGDLATDRCSVACNGCSRCASDAAPGVIKIENGLARINYDLNHLAGPEAIKRCPTGAIVWMESEQQFAIAEKDPMPLGRIDSQYDAETYYQ